MMPYLLIIMTSAAELLLENGSTVPALSSVAVTLTKLSFKLEKKHVRKVPQLYSLIYFHIQASSHCCRALQNLGSVNKQLCICNAQIAKNQTLFGVNR